MLVSDFVVNLHCKRLERQIFVPERLPETDRLFLDLRDARARIAELEAQLAEARRDGERYRHIRTEAGQYVYENYRARFDAAIDEVMQRSKGDIDNAH